MTTLSTVTDRELAMLAVESKVWLYVGKKEQAVLEQFGLSLTRFYQVINQLIDREDVLAHDPILVKRLRRLRNRRLATRRARRTVFFEDVPDPVMHNEP